MFPNAKDLAISQMMVAYGNRQNVTARANNSELLRPLKQLMETRLKKLRSPEIKYGQKIGLDKSLKNTCSTETSLSIWD